MIYCPECENHCSQEAPFCPKCGRPLKPLPAIPVATPVPQSIAEPTAPSPPQHTPQPQPIVVQGGPAWNPGVAAVLSFFIPGLGQLYKGQLISGFAWFCLVIVGYFLFVLPGLLLHLCCIVGATMGDPYPQATRQMKQVQRSLAQ